MKNTEIFFVTYKPHFNYLVYALRSIEKFARNFDAVRILVPHDDLEELKKLVSELSGESGIPFFCCGGEEWPGKGFLWHAKEILCADEWCPSAEFICHTDPDVVFTAPVTPETFIKDRKPILRYEAFATIGLRHPGVLQWQKAAERCLPFAVENECMRTHPEVYCRNLYAKTRELISQATGMPYNHYIAGCRNEYPQTFAEFPTIGAVAMKLFADQYELVDCAKQENPDFQDVPVFQAWGHAAPDVATDLWYKGRPQRIVPLDIYKELGIA